MKITTAKNGQLCNFGGCFPTCHIVPQFPTIKQRARSYSSSPLRMPFTSRTSDWLSSTWCHSLWPLTAFLHSILLIEFSSLLGKCPPTLPAMFEAKHLAYCLRYCSPCLLLELSLRYSGRVLSYQCWQFAFKCDYHKSGCATDVKHTWRQFILHVNRARHIKIVKGLELALVC